VEHGPTPIPDPRRLMSSSDQFIIDEAAAALAAIYL
jgi:hypothetical protein